MLGHTDLPEGDTAAHATASSTGGTTNLSLLPPFGANLYELLSNTVSSVATMPYVHRVLQSITSRIVYHFLSESPLLHCQEVFIIEVYANSAYTPYSYSKMTTIRQ